MPDMERNSLGDVQTLLARAKHALAVGDTALASRCSRQALALEPKNLEALLLAARSSATRSEALAFLKQAQTLSPENPEVFQALDWALNLPPGREDRASGESKEHARPVRPWWVSQPLPPARKRQWRAAVALGSLVLALALGAFYFAPLLMPRAMPVEPADHASPTLPAVPTQTVTLLRLPATWTPAVTPITTEATSTRQPTQPFFTATPVPTLAVALDEAAYPPLDVERFYADPGVYAGQRLSLAAEVVWLGEIEVNGIFSFALLLEAAAPEGTPVPPRSPILLVDVPPSYDLQVGQALKIFGVGISPGGVILVQGMRWGGPVLSFNAVEVLP